MTLKSAKVYLVGAGPGDHDLITVKGRRCIVQADVVIYDYLAAPDLLRYASPTAELIYVGKKGGDHTLSQEGINQLIVDKARAGNIVTRLKGGDPFIFGRGGEEAEILAEQQIPFEIVPGVTSAIAAPAYAGIPLTHRDYTATVAFVTGHEDPTRKDSRIDWAALAGGIGTIVFLMGVKNLPKIVGRLIENGRDPQTPVCLVRWGTRSDQKTVCGTLETIVAAVAQAGLKAPAVIVVGKVARLRPKLSWFENRPLFGRRIVVTRARAQASDLVSRLSALGATCLMAPAIEIVDPDDQQIARLRGALADLDRYDWLVFTSVNGVDRFFRHLDEQGLDARALGHLKTATIGPATAARLRSHGLKSDLMPDNYRAESVVAAFGDHPMRDVRVLLPRAAQARPILPVALAEMGAHVDEIEIYATKPVAEAALALNQALADGAVDMVTFTSSSTVKNFVQMLPTDRIDTLLKAVKLASIGPITSQTAADQGLKIDIEAATYTIDGLVAAISGYFASREPIGYES